MIQIKQLPEIHLYLQSSISCCLLIPFTIFLLQSTFLYEQCRHSANPTVTVEPKGQQHAMAINYTGQNSQHPS